MSLQRILFLKFKRHERERDMARKTDFHQMFQLFSESGFHGQERFGGNIMKTFFFVCR
jgi:hypothetical protein